MPAKLPTAKELRTAQREKIKQEEKEARAIRAEARALLFGKAGGKLGRLSKQERGIVIRAKKIAYNMYCYEKSIGRRVRPMFKPMVSTEDYRVLPYRDWQKLWWCRNKAAYRRADVPNQMKQRMRELENAK